MAIALLFHMISEKVGFVKLNDVTTRQLRYLVALDDTCHFRRAAEMCDISQPSLSAQIQNLEGILGVSLVERNRSGIALSPVGREVSKRARVILNEIQAIKDFSAGAQHGLAGTIRLGAKSTLGPYLLPHVVLRLHVEYPDLSLYVREAPPQELVHELSRGLHDVIIAQLPVTGVDLTTTRLFREPLKLALAIDHPLAKKEKITTKDLMGLEVLSLSPQYHLHKQINTLCEDYGATILRNYEGTSLDALRLMVGMGMGVAFLPAIYVETEIAPNSDVIVRTLDDRVITRSVGLVWRKNSNQIHAYQKLTDIIRDVVRARFPSLIIDG